MLLHLSFLSVIILLSWGHLSYRFASFIKDLLRKWRDKGLQTSLLLEGRMLQMFRSISSQDLFCIPGKLEGREPVSLLILQLPLKNFLTDSYLLQDLPKTCASPLPAPYKPKGSSRSFSTKSIWKIALKNKDILKKKDNI